MRICCVMLVVLGLGVAALAVPAADKSDPERIAQHIKNLGSDEFKEREKASESLNAVGEPALDALRKALQSDDAEITRRAEELIKKIDRRVQTEKVLKPTRVHLVCKDTPVKEAVADLAKKSNFKIVLHDPQNKLADRKVTLDTGETTFWEAFDQFCDKAGLKLAGATEAFGARPMQPVPQPRPRRLPIRRGQPVPAPVPQPLPVPLVPPPLPPQVGLQPGEAPPGVPGAVPGNPGPGMPGAVFVPGIFPGLQLQPGVLTLVDVKPEAVPTHYAGAVRVRALPAERGILPAGVQILAVNLDVFPEPRIQCQSLEGVRIDKAVDDRGQLLAPYDLPGLVPGQVGIGFAPPGIMVGQPGGFGVANPFRGGLLFIEGQRIQFTLKPAEKESKSLKELKGTISALMLTEPEPVITVDNIMKAAGKIIKGKDGRSINVLEVAKDAKGEIRIRVEKEILPGEQIVEDLFGPGIGIIPPNAGIGGGMMGGPVQMGGGFGGIGIMPPNVGIGGGVRPAQIMPVPVQPIQPGIKMPGLAPEQAAAFGLMLVDDKGKNILRAIAPSGSRFLGNRTWNEYTLFTLPKEDRREPAKLVYSGRRTVTVDIPFTLKDVPLK